MDLDNPSGPWPRLRRFSPKDEDGVPTVGIWCIDVIPEDGKSVKTATSKRIIPIHPLLLELGFLDYIAAQKRDGKRDLFPGLRPEKATRAGENLGEWFSRYLGCIGMKRERLSFQSFRHSFNTHLFNREVPDPGKRADGARVARADSEPLLQGRAAGEADRGDCVDQLPPPHGHG